MTFNKLSINGESFGGFFDRHDAVEKEVCIVTVASKPIPMSVLTAWHCIEASCSS
jgi:hypothetical protein